MKSTTAVLFLALLAGTARAEVPWESGLGSQGDLSPRFYLALGSLGVQAGYHWTAQGEYGDLVRSPLAIRATAVELRYFVSPRLALGVTTMDVAVDTRIRYESGIHPKGIYGLSIPALSASYLTHAGRRQFRYATAQLDFLVPGFNSGGAGISVGYSIIPLAPLPIEAYVRAAYRFPFRSGYANPRMFHAAFGVRTGLGWWFMRRD